MEQRQSHDYFQRRAEEERAAADRAADERAAQMHRELAKEYARLAQGEAHMEQGKERALPGILAKEFRILP
jgi:hypothetical protein